MKKLQLKLLVTLRLACRIGISRHMMTAFNFSVAQLFYKVTCADRCTDTAEKKIKFLCAGRSSDTAKLISKDCNKSFPTEVKDESVNFSTFLLAMTMLHLLLVNNRWLECLSRAHMPVSLWTGRRFRNM